MPVPLGHIILLMRHPLNRWRNSRRQSAILTFMSHKSLRLGGLRAEARALQRGIVPGGLTRLSYTTFGVTTVMLNSFSLRSHWAVHPDMADGGSRYFNKLDLVTKLNG